MKKKKLKLDDISVQSFVTEFEKDKDKETVMGGVTGNCLSDLYTCAKGCDFESVPLNECTGAVCVGASILSPISCIIIWD
ncbi:MAG: pinensin family lanthipeptide [Bacteroidota bacterium]